MNQKNFFLILLVFILGILFNLYSFSGVAKERQPINPTSRPSTQPAHPINSSSNHSSAPRCEKCYRGPNGKIQCDPVPCPK
jgi:hypothetical protein